MPNDDFTYVTHNDESGGPRKAEVRAMANAAFYRAEAKRYRERAAAAKDPVETEQWLRFAKEQETLAALLDEDDDRLQQPVPNKKK